MTKVILIAAMLMTLARGASAMDTPPAGRESIEWCDIWISHAHETNLPRVLLIGDSITHAYYSEVEKKLAGRAYVARLSTSAFISDPVLLKQLAMVLGMMKFEVVHFNNGMHGWQHDEKEYAAAFPVFVKAIEHDAPAAKLIWANTTPLKLSLASPGPAEASDARIEARNRIALKWVQTHGIPVDDLHALCAGHPEFHSDNVHFNDQGVALQAAQVAGKIESALNNFAVNVN